jgi:uncharacterized protein (TIGR03067 family)
MSKDDKVTCIQGKRQDIVTVKLYPEKTPKALDLIIPGDILKDEPIRGIYQLEKDNLKVCLARLLDPRPTEFQSTPESMTLLIVLQRK